MNPNQIACLVVAFATCSAAAQEPSRGMFPGVPMALSVAGGGGLASGQILAKDPGFHATQPGNDPRFHLALILTQHGAPASIGIDDFSLGQDWILADNQTGRVVVPPNNWAAITFSVTANTAGAPRSRIAAEASSRGGVGADIFSYVLQGSALPAPFVGVVERVHDSTEMGLGAATPEVDGLDLFAPLYGLETGLLQFLPTQREIYFTVSNSSVGQVPNAWWANTPPSGATIFVTSQSFASGAWSQPAPFLTFSQLGMAQADDIDGLALDLEDSRVLFSLRGASALSQLIFGYFGTDIVVPMPYVEPDGVTPVSTSIGVLQNDDIDAICSTDPSVRAHNGQPNAIFFTMGTPQPPLFPGQPSISATAFRDFVNGNTTYMSYMVGYPPVTGQGAGFAALFLTFGNTLAPVVQLGPLLLRSPAPLFAGDPKRFGLTVPANLNLSLHAIPLVFHWFAADAAFTELAEAWPVHVVL